MSSAMLLGYLWHFTKGRRKPQLLIRSSEDTRGLKSGNGRNSGKFPVSTTGAAMITSKKIMRSHMARYEERGCGASRSVCFLPLHLGVILVVAVLVCFAGYIRAQDVNVHIEPKPSPSPTPTSPPVAVSTESPDSSDPNAKSPEVSNDPGLKVNHG